ncbi:hypothetical protein FIV42_04925 [Persicimonas caeni]|jgi:H+/gluconate symporter-like permease|uniref:Uncharacterized protein n=1 Tax=Persicimonas caeni TaxID=2292766 RepID=A0A4Y6PPB2_PERCE|nr:hypothetical protein [Persicimonas caeni]QDG50100.1 hypothetical protein FIV42_04925 [Persicimonas caeni]QED31321.1 hypothetical protein FRD00_04920 [Persicimonas caeni]
MGDELFIAFYIATPIVLLAAAFVYYLYRRREDIERVSRSNVPPREEGETRPGQNQTPRNQPTTNQPTQPT